MASIPNNVDLEREEFLLKLLQEYRDEMTKLASRLHGLDTRMTQMSHVIETVNSMPHQVISRLVQEYIDELTKLDSRLHVVNTCLTQTFRVISLETENSMHYQVISRAKETGVKQCGLGYETLMSWGLSMPAEAQVIPSQVAGSLQNVEVTRDMTANLLGNEMVRPDAYASIKTISASSGSGRGTYQASGSHISGYPQSATEATQDNGDAMQFDAIFEMRDSFDLRQPRPATEATLDKGDALHFDASVDLLGLSDVVQTLSAPEDSARHQADHVEIDAINCQRNVVNVDLGKQNKTKRIAKEYGITLEVIKQKYGKKLIDAANSLGVARSTFKRICRDYKIYRWPRVKSRKGSCSLSQAELSQDVDRQPSDSGGRHQQYDNISLRSSPKSVTNSKELPVPMLSEKVISVKVICGNRTVRFPLSLSSGKKDLEEVEKRIKVAGNLSIWYEDEESDLILITCDSDLHYAVQTLRSLGRTIIKMLAEIEPGTTMTYV